MQNHKLILIIKTFSKKELNSFIRLVKTPYFNRKEELVLLFEYLKKQYPNFTEEKVKKEKLFSLVFKEKKFNKRFFDDIIYYSNKLLEHFLVMEHLNNDAYSASKLLAKEMKERKLTDLALKELAKSKKLLGNKKLNLQTDIERYEMNLKEYLWRESKYNSDDLVPLKLAINTIDLYYWKNKLWLNDQVNSRAEISNELNLVVNESDMVSINSSFLKNKDDLALKILYFINKLDTKADFIEIFEELKKSKTSIDHHTLLLFISGLTNYCKKQYAKTQELVFTKYWFELYQFGYLNDIYVKTHKLNDSSFLNTVHLGLVHKEYDWVNFYIKDYKKHLIDKTLFNLSNAMYNFELKNYDIVLEDLIEVNFGHIHQNLTARSLIAKTYFEMKEFELLHSHLKAFDIYLRRDKQISEHLKRVNLNFVSATKKLVEAQYNTKAKASLQKDLKEKPIAYKTWLKSLI